MNLGDAQIRPGIIKEIVDNKGTIKACVAGLFDEEDYNLLPPIVPFFSINKGSFSTPEIGDPIWCLFCNNNPQLLFYVRQANYSEELNDIIKKNSSNCEVVLRRNKGLQFAQLYFNDDEGWILQQNDSVINIKADGSVKLSNGDSDRVIEINTKGISLGNEGKSEYHAVLGEKVLESFKLIDNLLQFISKAAKANPYTTGISTAIDANIKQYQEKIDTILSDSVTLN